MGYIHEIEQELKGKLAGLAEEDRQEVLRYTKEKILESFRNGLAASKKGLTRPRGKTSQFKKRG